MQPLIKPQINLNGTSKEQLLQQQMIVMAGFRELLSAMSDAMPHGRDYQFRPSEYPLARDAWLERMKAIQAIEAEIFDHAMAISDET